MNDIKDQLESLRRTPKILSEFVRAIPEQRLDLRRGEAFWTIAEHISHLAEVQPMMLDRVKRFTNEDHPEFVPYIPSKADGEPDSPPRMDMTSALVQFAEYRNKQLLLLESADNASWEKTATHPEYEAYSLYILTRHVLMHDYWHMYRIEELWLTKDPFLTRV